jgi:hypothetical protein
MKLGTILLPILGAVVAVPIMYFSGCDNKAAQKIDENLYKRQATEYKQKYDAAKKERDVDSTLLAYASQGYDCEQGRIDSLAKVKARKMADSIFATEQNKLRRSGASLGQSKYPVSQLYNVVKEYNVDPNGKTLIMPGTQQKFGDFMAQALQNGIFYDIMPDVAEIKSIRSGTVDIYDIFNVSQSILPMYNWAVKKSQNAEISDYADAAYEKMIEGLKNGKDQQIRFQTNR